MRHPFPPYPSLTVRRLTQAWRTVSARSTTRDAARGWPDRRRRNARALVAIARWDTGDKTSATRDMAGSARSPELSVRSMHNAFIMMKMKAVKHSLHTFGDRSGDLARTIGAETADFAKKLGSETTDLAKQFGNQTVSLAKRIGPRRGLIGLAIFAVAVGGTVVMIRRLRARKLDNKREAREAGEDTSADRSMKSGNRPAAPQRSPGAHTSH
jgi:hypothetical protein